MKRQTVLTRLAILAVTVMLTACGFHLRGSTLQDDLPFKSIYIVNGSNSDISIELKRYLRGGGTTVASDPKDAEAIMEVLSENRQRKILSLNSQGRVREYGLTYALNFRVRDNQGNVLLAPTTINLYRKYNYTESDAAARANEQDSLYQDMQYDLVQRILRRLSAIKMNPPKPK